MTKIIVDKKTALRAVCKYFNIPLLGTDPEYYFTPDNTVKSPYNIEIYFDFESDYNEDAPQDAEEIFCPECGSDLYINVSTLEEPKKYKCRKCRTNFSLRGKGDITG